MEKFKKIKLLVLKAEVDAIKFYLSNNMAAGHRLRVQMQELRNQAQALSFEIGNLL
ncbi:MAG: histone H1 [Pedobacter sp.]|nr:histone H1 [Pedobacter sp.]